MPLILAAKVKCRMKKIFSNEITPISRIQGDGSCVFFELNSYFSGFDKSITTYTEAFVISIKTALLLQTLSTKSSQNEGGLMQDKGTVPLSSS